MKYLKTYEGLFDFFKKKKKEPTEVNDKEFLEKHLEEVRSCFLELNDQYKENREEEVDNEKGYIIYYIDYNNNQVKIIKDYRLDVPVLKSLGNKIIKLKKKIKWTPVDN